MTDDLDRVEAQRYRRLRRLIRLGNQAYRWHIDPTTGSASLVATAKRLALRPDGQGFYADWTDDLDALAEALPEGSEPCKPTPSS